MKWSFKLIEIDGICVYIHATFLLVLVWIGWAHYLGTGSLPAAIEGVAFILALFACVVLHEFGHALAAKRYGIKTRDITLYPIGGVARLERMPDKPFEEFVVALAGPAVNVVIAAVLFVFLVATASWVPIEELGVASGSFLERVMIANLFLVVFNLLPAFPMDGGRVVRAILASQIDYTTATNIAAGIGQTMALLFGLVGLLYNPFLMLIALFVWIGAAQEAGAAQMKHALGGIPVIQAMITDFRTVSPSDPLQVAVDHILAGTQQDFPVVENGNVVGVLTRQDLVAALASEGRDTPIREAMQTDFRTMHPYDMLDRAMIEFQECQCRTIPVVHGQKLSGLLTMENVGEFMMIQSALEQRRNKGPGRR